MKTYLVEEIFEDIPEDDNNVLMKIPPEIAEEMGWEPGDVLKISIGDNGSISIVKVENE